MTSEVLAISKSISMRQSVRDEVSLKSRFKRLQSHCQEQLSSAASSRQPAYHVVVVDGVDTGPVWVCSAPRDQPRLSVDVHVYGSE